MESEIINKYQNLGISIEEICKEFRIGKLKVKKIFLDNHISIKKKGGQFQNKPTIEFNINIINKIIKCKNCGKEFNDVENVSGIAISHIKKCFPNVEIPSKLKRANFKKEKGTYWHFQYFDIIEKKEENREKLKCPDCDWSTFDISNKTGSFTKHVEKEHGIEEFTREHPSYTEYFVTLSKSIERKKYLEDDNVKCKICGLSLKYINQKHLDKHSISLREYKIKYLGAKFISNSTTQKLKDAYNNGLKYHENNYKSAPEIEIKNLIKKYDFNVLANDKKALNGTEIDIYVPALKLGFEYNGLYYHNESMGKDKWYHLNKQDLAKENGIKLIHIFEDEWLGKKDICIKKIINLIGKNNEKKIDGRKTIIKNIGKEESEVFLNRNHIQGSSPQTTYNIGAFYNNQLIGVMSFLKQHNSWILSRLSTDINYKTPGVVSKLLTHFVREHPDTTIITYGDRRWITDQYQNIYTILGFKLTNINEPDYRYCNFKISRYERIHKFNFRKKIILKHYGDIVNESMSEKEMTEAIGCVRIWDCGLFRYELKT